MLAIVTLLWAGRGATFHFTLPVAPAETNLPMDVA